MYALLSKIKPMRGDVLLKHKPKEKSSSIFVKENPEQEDLQHFVVCATGEEANSVEVGDVVVISWTRVTEPFTVIDDRDGGDAEVKVGITNHTEILAVIEGATENDIIC